jgi:hypothetical protein
MALVEGIPGSKEERIRRSALLVALYSAPLSMALKPSILNDNDIWFHLRTGQWILEHARIPITDPFSLFGADKPWAAYSWLFEVGVYGAYKAFNLLGIVIFEMALSLAIAGALHRLVSRLQPSFTKSVVLTAMALFAITPFFSPRPWLFTLLFFIIELDIVLSVRESGDHRGLLILIPIFCLWANLHIQFLYGLFLLALAVAEPVICNKLGVFFPGEIPSAISPRRGAIIAAGCVLATLVNPYHFKLYGVLLDYMTQGAHLKYIQEFQALPFRDYHSFLVLFITMGGVFTLAWNRRVSPLPLLLLVSGAFISFRSMRDCWFVVIVATCIIASSSHSNETRYSFSRYQRLFVSTAILLVFLSVAWARTINERTVSASVAEKFPEEAVKIIASRGYLGPLYNYYDWGSYLIWKLPNLPVSMDGRTHLHGDERIAHSIAAWNGAGDWDSDPELQRARLVVGPSGLPLVSLLRCDSRFQLVYEDPVAAVFVAR